MFHLHQKKMLSFLFFSLIFITGHLTSQNAAVSVLPQNVQQTTLENGMQIFLLENHNDALIHIKLVIKAGFSSQTQENNGFFKLLTRIITSSNKNIPFSQAECLADATVFSMQITPQQLSDVLQNLCSAVFEQNYSQQTLQNELTSLKNEVTKNSKELSNLINASIDSRVFSDAPWKHDSGIYPPLFSKTTPDKARTILSQIADRFYTPQNSAIFITGNFYSDKIITELNQTFGKYYSNYKTPVTKPSIPANKQRKFVFHHEEISPELTQVVVQYTMMNLEECELLSALLNNDYSSFKNHILNQQELNIPGWEYINVSAAHKKDTSRLIIQTLMQLPDKKSKSTVSSIKQVQQFLQNIENISHFITPQEFINAQNYVKLTSSQFQKNPVDYMEKLSDFYVISPYVTPQENLSIPQLFTEKNMRITKLGIADIQKQLEAEEPFVFVFVNSKDYKANLQEYKKAGFEEINEKKSSWYMQELFKETKNQYQLDAEKYAFQNVKNTTDNAFFEQNLAQIKEIQLKNGVKVYSKQNFSDLSSVLTLSINGGQLNSADDNGFEEVMCTLASNLIQTELNKMKLSGIICNDTQITSKTDLQTTSIFIEFNKDDSYAVCSAIQKALIFGEIPPATADKAVSSRQYKKRLENGSAIKQMESAVIKNLYGQNDFYKIFETQNDILQSTNYNSILQSYPLLLDSSRYNIIICGDFDDNIFDYLEDLFSYFPNVKQPLHTCSDLPQFKKSKAINVKINHTFLTDIPAELAGPQPAVLVPTTEFLDPVIYAIPSPKNNTKESALFNAMLNIFQKEFQQTLAQKERTSNNTVKIEYPKSKMEFALITIMDVKYTKEVDSAYKTTRENIIKKLTSSKAFDFITEIKNLWTLNQMKDTSSNLGTSKLLQKGIEYSPDNPNPTLYLQEYNFIQQATIQDFTEIMNFLPLTVPLRAYGTN